MILKSQERHTMSYHTFSGKIGYVYILSNKKRSVLYIGVTKDLNTRIYQHKMGEGSKFTKKYKAKYLIYFEKYPNINQAIQREKQLKNWHRDWKMNLIRKMNPNLKDLWGEIH